MGVLQTRVGGATTMQGQTVLENRLESDSYTICSPQLLHLDMEGNPLWFNGWLAENKFVGQSQQTIGKFEHFLIEPPEAGRHSAWIIKEHNNCCLTTGSSFMRKFALGETRTLQMMIHQAKSVVGRG